MARGGFLLSLFLFVLTLLTTTLAGVQWLHKDPLDLENFTAGLPYSSLLLLVLLSHASGHWVAARKHNVETTWPLLIPFPFFSGNPFGTWGAPLRIKGRVPSKKALFDIGASGCITGFVVSIVVLAMGFMFLPSKEYLYSIHPEYANLNSVPAGGLAFGNSFLYSIMSGLLPSPQAFVPPINEIYHYPLLCTGWFGLLLTAVNLLPVGQLDGGHISLCMFGKRYDAITKTTLVLLAVLGLSGLLPLFGVPFDFGWYGWLILALVVMAFMKSGRDSRLAPGDNSPLDSIRFAVGVGCWVILVLSFSPTPFSF